MLRRGQIHPVVSQRLPLTEVRQAHELLESSASTGKLVTQRGARRGGLGRRKSDCKPDIQGTRG
jgi:Zinc-binding dehydrogenase